MQNYKQAANFYKLAAEQGDTSSQINLGVFYEHGRGVSKNIILAHMWFNIASINGDVDAKKNREIVQKKMKINHIEEAQDLAKICLQKNLKNCNFQK